MMHCYAEGALRAYLDGALPAEERAQIAAHLDNCLECRRDLDEQRARAAHIGALLPTPAASPEPQAALARLRAEAPLARARRSIAPPDPFMSEALLGRNSMS